MGQLIAGHDPDRVADEEGLADFVGANTLSIAALVPLVATVEQTDFFDGSEAIWIAFVGGVVGLAVRTIRGARRYEKPARIRVGYRLQSDCETSPVDSWAGFERAAFYHS